MPAFKNPAKAKGITLRLLLSIGIFLLSLFIIFSIIHEVLYEKETRMDEKICNWMAPYRTPLLTRFVLVVPFFGSQKFLLPVE